MTLSSGSKLGPYEILSPLGAGGMGEVYRAKDSRLGREVAIKVLPESTAKDPEALARFEREAKAVAALSHPNILALFDVGHENGVVYAVMELLEGETLRAQLTAGMIPPRKLVDCAKQIADGLAAAHEKGVIHRDLKPENLFVTHDGRMKILDFGLAKLQVSPGVPVSGENTPTRSIGTEPGVTLGTVGYMSPEQVRGEPADHRSDIFSFGAVLYEMSTGKRAFKGDSAVETMNAILKEEPPEISLSAPIAPAIERVTRHCLEKKPGARFQSARDLAFALETAASSTSGSGARPALAGGGLSHPAFKRLSFGKGAVDGARFAPASQDVMFSARWNGQPPEIFSLHPGGLEPRRLGIQGATLLSVTPSGELAVKLESRLLGGFDIGLLAQVAPGGGARVIQEEVLDADWIPGGSQLAIIRGGRNPSSDRAAASKSIVNLEFPAGHAVPLMSHLVSAVRVSPSGDRVACFEQPTFSQGDGRLVLVDLHGNRSVLTTAEGLNGLAWGPDGKEIWFSEYREGGSTLWAVTDSGAKRLLMRQAGILQLMDVAPDGRVLALLSHVIAGVMGMDAPDFREKELSWNDASMVHAISPDGTSLLLGTTFAWDTSSARQSVYLRKADGSIPVRLGEGWEAHFMPDGRQILLLSGKIPTRFNLVPLGPGLPRELPIPSLQAYQFYPLADGKRAVVAVDNCYSLLNLADGTHRPIAEPHVTSFLGAHPVSPDGEWVVLSIRSEKLLGGHLMLYSTTGAAPVAVQGALAADITLCWSGDGKSIYVFNRDGLPARIERIELATGNRTLFKEIMPANPTGMAGILSFVMTPDARHLAYNYIRKLSDLYLIEGLK